MEYLTRTVEREIQQVLRIFPAVQLTGVKGCGKTSTGEQLSRSYTYLESDPAARLLAQNAPDRLLSGPYPQLLDEWTTVEPLWNAVRWAADHPRDGEPANGRFLMTSSASRTARSDQHSLFDRVATVQMRTMSLWESGHSEGSVSLSQILTPQSDGVSAKPPEQDIVDVVELICRGGWPRSIGYSIEDAMLANIQRARSIAATEVGTLTDASPDPRKVERFLSSYSRNVGTYAALTTLATDTGLQGNEPPIDADTARRYVGLLQQLMVIEDLPAWLPHLRSKAQMRSGSKRFLVDPALAVAALRASPQQLLGDRRFLGFLFESLVVRDLRTYAPTDAHLAQYRDNKGHEVDAIIQTQDGTWAAFEIKIGQRDSDKEADPIDRAARSLTHFATRIVDPARTGPPVSLNVVTATGPAYRRADGVNVFPITALRP